MRGRQLSLLKESKKHGGDLRRGKRKTRRPIDPKRPMHLVFRSSMAVGARSMLHPVHCRKVDAKVRALADSYRIRLYRYANVGNHLHLVIQGKTRDEIQNFLRAVGGKVAQLITGARKGNPIGKRFWDELVFSRVVEWGKDLKNAIAYVAMNADEGIGKGSACMAPVMVNSWAPVPRQVPLRP